MLKWWQKLIYAAVIILAVVFFKKKLLNALESIDGTLKRIEQDLTHEAVKEAVFHVLQGEKCKCGKSAL